MCTHMQLRRTRNIFCAQAAGVGQLVSHRWCHTAGVTQPVSHSRCHTAGVTQVVSHSRCHTGGVTQVVSHRWCHTAVVTQVVSHRWAHRKPAGRPATCLFVCTSCGWCWCAAASRIHPLHTGAAGAPRSLRLPSSLPPLEQGRQHHPGSRAAHGCNSALRRRRKRCAQEAPSSLGLRTHARWWL